MYANADVQKLPYSVRECSKRVSTLNFESISSGKLRDVDSDGD